MREYQIELEPFKYKTLRNIVIKGAVNNHAEASVTMRGWVRSYILFPNEGGS